MSPSSICLVLLLAVMGSVVGRRLFELNQLSNNNENVAPSKKNCSWTQSDCIPRRGSCGRGVIERTLTGENCPTKTRRVRCKVSCRSGVQDRKSSRLSLSPSQAGLVGYPVKRPKFLNDEYKLLDCEYKKSGWSPCDPGTNRMTRTLTLINGDKSICKPEKVIKKMCKRRSKRKDCTYTKSSWTACNPQTRLQSRTVSLMKGSSSKCHMSKTVSRRCRLKKVKPKVSENHCDGRKNPEKCRRRQKLKDTKMKGNFKGCKYAKDKWGPCDRQTNIKRRKLTLVRGNERLCSREKIKVKTCKKSKQCKYNRGPWTGCVSSTRIKSRVDSLKPGSPDGCNATRHVVKDCKQRISHGKECRYEVSAWGNCSTETMKRTRTKLLVAGDPAKCKKEKTDTRACVKNNGEERCFFGSYSSYGPCRNGVKTKTRKLIAGPETCQRKAAKTKPCPLRN